MRLPPFAVRHPRYFGAALGLALGLGLVLAYWLGQSAGVVVNPLLRLFQ